MAISLRLVIRQQLLKMLQELNDMEKAYSTLSIKSVDNEKRIIKGIASSISPDRANDIVEPGGMVFDLPFPFLWQHDHSKPIGNVIAANRTSKGLEIEVRIAKIKEAGSLKDQVDHAWNAIKEGLVRGLSIGFRALDYDVRQGGGIHYTATEIFEVSAVTIPCNAQATITDIKRASNSSIKLSSRGHTTVKLNTGGVQLSPIKADIVADDLNHQEKLLAAQLAYADPVKRKSLLEPFINEFGEDKANKVRLMADSLRGDL